MTVPKLRFPEFRDAGEWEKLRLSDVSDRITEKVGNRKLMTSNSKFKNRRVGSLKRDTVDTSEDR